MQLKLSTMPFGNGAGSIKTHEQVLRACKGPTTRITVGSITANQRAGNIGDTYYFHPQHHWSLNSLGLPGAGMAVYVKLLPEMARVAHGEGKELWASISPFSPEECGQMAEQCLKAGADGVEVNGSCPNVWDSGARKDIPALDPPTAVRMFEVLGVYVGRDGLARTSFKLSPTPDRKLLTRLATALQTAGINKLVCCNTFADQSGTRVDGKPALSFRASEGEELRHVGGLAGTLVHDLSIRVTQVMHELMPNAEILGSGGVFIGPDAEAYLKHGASGFQSTTGYLEFGNQLFVDALMYLSDKFPE